MKFKEISPEKYKWQLFMLLLVCFASAILGDSTAEALLLSNYDTSIVPRMFLVNALALFIISSIMMTVIDIVDRGSFFLSCLVIHSAMLILFRIIISFKIVLLFPFLFSYAYITKILIFMLFWTLANDLVDSRKAGKAFPVIAAGGTLGAVAVSFSIPSMLKVIQAENLIIIWCILIIAAIFLFLPVKRNFGRCFLARTDRKRRDIVSIIKDLQLFRQEPLLGNMGILYFFMFFLLLNQHYIFYTQIKNHFTTAGGVASFLGYFNGVSMISTFLLQITVAGVVLRKFGSTRSMLFIPAFLMIFFAGLVIMSLRGISDVVLFYVIIAGMGLRIAFFDSFFSPNFQLFFSSLPQEIRGRGKLTMEGVVKPLAMVLSGVWLLWVGEHLSLSVQMIIMFFIAVLTVLLSWRIKGCYAESLTNYLTGFSGKKKDERPQTIEMGSEIRIAQLAERISGEEPEVQKFLIQQIATVKTSLSVKILKEHFVSGNERMRATILSVIRGTDQQELFEIIEQSIYDSDFRVVANATLAVFDIPGMDPRKHLSYLINYYHPRVRANCIFSAWKHADTELKTFLLKCVHGILYNNYPNETASALYALGEMDGEAPFLMLNDFIRYYNDNIHENASVFNQTIRALSKKSSINSARMLLSFAKRSSKTRKVEIVKALASIWFGVEPGGILHLIKKSDYRTFNLIVAACHQHVFSPDEQLEMVLRERAEAERKALIDYLYFYQEVLTHKGNGAELLGYAILEEHIDLRIDSLLHIASIIDTSHRIRKILPRLFHNNAHMRARAFEVMDNTGDTKFNRSIMKIIDIRLSSENVRTNVSDRPWPQVSTDQFLDDPSEWVARCARYALRTAVRQA